MNKNNNTFKSFFIIMALIWVISDIVLIKIDPLKHPEKVWDKVFFGSSVVIASYIEEKSNSGYYNVGVDYGTISDIYNMLKKNRINIGSELVVGLNDISFLDSLDTNMTYIWHKEWYQHYIFFTRDKTYPIIESGIKNVLDKKPFLDEPKWANQEKSLYHGNLSDDELKESNESMIERFGDCTIKDCTKNLADLEKLIKLCKKKNIRLRFIWMPWNPKVPIYGFATETMNEANRIFKENNIEVYNMTNMIEPEYFYDIGHMSYEVGAPYFTYKVDDFLCK